MRTLSLPFVLPVLLLSALLVTSCAQSIGDVDRTQANVAAKADFDGVWYYMETVVDVPAAAEATFEGETSRMEKIVWRIEEDWLFAHRAYPLIPGSDDVENATDYGAADYAEEPVAAFPILAHFDVQRGYNAATGEQTNTIGENYSDRPWFERDFMRVDWSSNAITNWDFISEWIATPIEGTFTVDSERGEERGLYWERDDNDELAYFDVPRRLLVAPDLIGCLLSSPWYSRLYEDCTAADVEVVMSFARTEPRRDYEPMAYSDQNMSRYGYFLNERYVYDTQRGVLESTRSKMINRHNFWAQTYERDGDGDYLLDDEGRRVPIPLADRPVGAVPYYLNVEFSDEDLMLAAAEDTILEWDDVAREVVATIQGRDVADVPNIFILCHNPVIDADADACGEVGFSPRPGDLRYSTLHLITAETQQGLLGYGPSATDPETGEIVSGRAYVYGAAVNTYASYALDVIRFTNGDLSPEELRDLEHVREQVSERAAGSTRIDRVDPSLRDIPIGADRPRQREMRDRREIQREVTPRFDRAAIANRLERAREAGISMLVAQEEFEPTLASALGATTTGVDPDELDAFDPARWLTPTHARYARERRMRRIARSADYIEMLDPNVAGMAQSYEGRTDYDQMWLEIRAELFRATALHEIGHTVGLRHNFSGSYDSLNYQDEYWNLRRENLSNPSSMFDLYELTALTDTQVEGRMREYQYSSIMDYGLTFNSDIQGLGRYDRAAMMFGYSGGTDANGLGADQCAASGGRIAPDGRCLEHREGFVEVFSTRLESLGLAGEILSDQDELGLYYEDPTAPHVPYLERWHYTTFMQGFPTLAAAFARDWMRLDDYVAERDSGVSDRAVRVPYLFCSDEWESALLSCRVFDGGADPFEVTRNVVDDYRAYYYFQYFKRDRFGWRPWRVLFSHFFNTFLPLSDYYQNWYLSPDGYDDVMDDYYWMSINMGFNLIAESMATPSYGTYCTGTNGQLYNLTDEGGSGPEQTSDYFLTAYCDSSQPFYEVPQGDGRRRFTAYDVQSGYNFPDLPNEAGHYWSTLAATWALFDPEAFVLGSDGDAGTYAIQYYDLFDDQIDELVGNILTENYGAYSPVMEVRGENGDNLVGNLHYQPIARVWDPIERRYLNPETGEVIDTALGPRRLAALCESCTSSNQCNGSTGALGGTYCQPLEEGGTEFFCVQDCTNDAGLCDGDHTCDATGNCVPDSLSCDGNVPTCSGATPNGACEDGLACVAGDCVEPWPIVETDATFSLMDDLVFYGMLYSTASWSTRYNDRVNIVKVGTGETIDAGEGFMVLSFTDPISGEVYGTVVEDCESSTSARCDFNQIRPTPASEMINRGRELAARYDATMRAYWEDDGSDAVRENELWRHFSRSRFELSSHLEKINDIRAIFNIFGRVY